MCGITGIWHLDSQPVYEEKINRFTNSIAHRGPDGSGSYIDEQCQLALGHRRLSILDLSEQGAQPMSYADGRYYISFNGEIFNFIELRKELSQKGYHFRSDTDTEVILAAWDCWGIEALQKFNGMWAFAIWDTHKKELFLSRDRFGIKPLYYTFLPNRLFAYASETTAFKQLNDFERVFDMNKVSNQIAHDEYLDSLGHTLFTNIFQLIGGHYLIIKQNDSHVQQRRWWNTLDRLESVPESYQDQVSRFKELFDSACLLRLRSDVPLASALSGGLDSSAVYCNLHHLKQTLTNVDRVPQNWQKAFVAVFPDTSQDEKSFAEQVIQYTNGDVQYIYPDFNNVLNTLVDTTIRYDHIEVTPIFIISEVYKAMRQADIRVSMDGHGVDEMLLGYPNFVRVAHQQIQLSKNLDYASDLAETYLRMYPESERAVSLRRLLSQQYKAPFNLKSYIFERLLSPKIKDIYQYFKKNILRQDINKVNYIDNQQWLGNPKPLSVTSLSDKLIDISHLSSIDQLLYQNFHETSLPTILRNFDRASMQHGIEIRMPFMDWRIVTYVFSLPLESKVKNGFTKRILRDSMQGIMPESIRNRTLKIGFNAPLREWFNHELREYVLDTTHSQSFLESAVWDGRQIANFVGQRNNLDGFECVQIWKYLNAHILISN